MTRGALLLLLVGCGESFTAAEEQRAFVEPPGGEGGEPITHTGGSGAGMAVGGAGSGGLPITTGGAPGSGGSGSMSGTGGDPSGAAGVSGESGAGGMGGSGGEPWMPSRCVEPSGLTVTATRAWEVELYFPPTSVVYLHEIEARWWFSREGECFLDPYWSADSGSRNYTATATLRLEPAAHATPEGQQTDVMILGQERVGVGEMVRTRQLLYFGGCSVEDDVSNDYSASAVEHVAVYVRGELVAGCEP